MHKWNEITDENSLKEFMERVSFFHDSCIKEMHYLSGAYVNEFQGLKYLKLFPADERYSCEILDSNIILKEDCIIWSDCEDKTELEDGDTGTLVCASKLRWRSIFGYMGEKNYW